MAQKDIVDTAVEAGSFTTLVTAVQAAGLEETLRGEGPYTVFAPTDDAFAAVPKETLDALLADPKGALTDVLTYHVVPGKVMSTDLSDGMQAETVNGQPLDITVADDGTVMVNGATVVTADIETANGVIHVIDTVLVPARKCEPPGPTGGPAGSAGPPAAYAQDLGVAVSRASTGVQRARQLAPRARVLLAHLPGVDAADVRMIESSIAQLGADGLGVGEERLVARRRPARTPGRARATQCASPWGPGSRGSSRRRPR